MFRTKTLVIELVAVLAVSLVASAPASAAAWKINGTTLASTAALAPTAAVAANPTLIVNGTTTRCTGNTMTFNGGVINNPNFGGVNQVVLNNCTVIMGPCVINSPTINIGPVIINITKGVGTKDLAVFSPKTKTVLATIGFSGEECAIAGVNPLTGKLSETEPTGQEEETDQEFDEASSSGELKLGSSAATLEFEVDLGLASGLKWSFS